MSVRVRHVLLDVGMTPSTNRHHRRCLFLFGVRRGCRKDAEHENTPCWVFSCSACVSVSRNHGNTPIVGGFRAIPVVEQVLLVPMQVLVKKHVPFWEMGTTAHHPPLNCLPISLLDVSLQPSIALVSRVGRGCGVENVDAHLDVILSQTRHPPKRVREGHG